MGIDQGNMKYTTFQSVSYLSILSFGLLFQKSHAMTTTERPQRISSRRRLLWRSAALMGLTFHPEISSSLSPKEASEAYDSYADNYDALDGGKASSVLGIEEARSSTFCLAKGDVLEIGVGTGLNLGLYDPTRIKSLTLLDVSTGMLEQAQKRIASLPSLKEIPVKFVRADATSELVDKFGLDTFDTVVDSFSLCTMGNEGAKRCLNQVSQVVKSKANGGQVLLLENSRSSNPLLGMYQDATATSAAEIGGKGCVYNQNVESMIQSTPGMTIEKQDLYAVGLFRSFQCSIV